VPYNLNLCLDSSCWGPASLPKVLYEKTPSKDQRIIKHNAKLPFKELRHSGAP
jgi:hypothetical protein